MPKFSDDRVRALVLGPRRAFRVFAFPSRPDVRVAVRMLTEREIDACRVEAQRQFITLCKAREWLPERVMAVDPFHFARLMDRQIIWRAFHDPDTINDPEKAEPFFPSDQDVAELDAVTTADLMTAYVEHQEFVSPSKSLTEKEVQELIEALGKGETSLPILGALERDSLRSLALIMARRLLTLPTGK